MTGVMLSFALFLGTFGVTTSFLEETCGNVVQTEFPECRGFFSDIQRLERLMSSMTTSVGNLQRKIDTMSVRLVNGTAYKGDVELYANGHWGSICDQDWDVQDGDVICTMLGYNSSRSVMRGHVTTMPYISSGVKCTGNEGSIFKCPSMPRGTYFGCDYNRAAGVDCQMGIRLVGSTHDTKRGRVEIQHFGEWGTICGSSWTDQDAVVVCRMLGLGGGRPISGATFGAGTGRILLSDVHCNGIESHILQCNHAPLRVHTCDHGSDVGVVCDSV